MWRGLWTATAPYQDYQGAGQLREKRPLSEKLAATTGERERCYKRPPNCIAAGHRGEAPGSNAATGITVKQALGHACHTAIIRALCIARMASALVYICYREEERYAGRRCRHRAQHALQESTVAALHGVDLP